jgi:hypothetical protein
MGLLYSIIIRISSVATGVPERLVITDCKQDVWSPGVHGILRSTGCR